MRRLLATAFAFASTFAAYPVLACGTEQPEQPVAIQRDDGSLLVEAARFDAQASADLAAATSADRDASRLDASARQLRADARLEPSARADLLQAADLLDLRASSARDRAVALRARGAELRLRASELRASVARDPVQVTVRVATPAPRPPRRWRHVL